MLSSRLNETLILYDEFPSQAREFRIYPYFFSNSSNIVPTKSLCIQSGKFVWVLYVDATCINYNGNVFDATLLAMVAALKNGS